MSKRVPNTASSIIAAAFQDALATITPTPDEVADGSERAKRIQTRLKKSFNVANIRTVGSFTKGTAVRGQSDWDLFVCLARDEARWGGRYVNSRTFLRRIGRELQALYPRTDVRPDGQAVSLRFTDGIDRVDVVPAFLERIGPEGAVFAIPDGQGDWLLTAPDRQRAYLNQARDQSTGKLPRVVQLVKWWRGVRTVAVSLKSFHIEMVLAREALCVGPASYAQLTAAAFQLLASREGRALRDPPGFPT